MNLQAPDNHDGHAAPAAQRGAAAPPHNRGKLARVERDEAGRLVVHVDGCQQPYVGARAARCFPWSVPDCFVSLCDSGGKEIALLKSIDELPPDSRRVVQSELRDKIFCPKIQRVVNYKHKFGVTSITAETDRGEVTFQIRSRDDVRVLGPRRAIFRGVDGNTYEVPDLAALDAGSRKWLAQYF